MTVSICKQELLDIAKKFDNPISKDEIDSILDTIQQRIERQGAIGESGINELIGEAREISKVAKRNAYLIKRNALINARAYGNLKTALQADPDNPQKVLSAIMVGDAKRGLFSVDAKGKAILDDTAGVFLADLQRNDVLELFRSGELDAQIYQELFDGFGSSKDKNARMIAEAIRKAQKTMLDRKNRAGANINELVNYVVRQNHDSLLMRGNGTEADKQEWINFISPLLDMEKTYKDMPTRDTDGTAMTPEKFLGQVYDNLVSGNHHKTDALYGADGKESVASAYKGASNLAKKLSSERVIHFKDGKSAFEYSNRYSRQPLREAVYSGFGHDAQSIALLETFGTNPRLMFEQVVDDIKGQLKGKPKLFERIGESSLKNQFAELDGTTRAIGAGAPVLNTSVTYAGIASGFRAVQAMSKLGFATISSFSDIATKAAFINSNTNRSVFSSYAVALSDTFRLFNSKEQKELAFLINVGVENELAEVHARFSANDSAPGVMSRLQQKFFKLNGMQWWNSTQKVGIARMLAADLAQYVKNDFDAVPDETKRLLGLYGITEAEWPLFRQLDLKMADGRNYLTTDSVANLSGEQLDAAISRQYGTTNITDDLRARYRDELRTKIAAYYSDSADTAIPTPGARERAIMNQGLPRGTVAGEAVRMIMQLKGFPITYVTKGLGRQYEAGGKMGVVKMMIGTTMMGYIANATKDILKGKEPMEVFDDETLINQDTFMRAFLQGGGLGIYGDFIFGEFNRFGQSPLETFAGPTLSTAGDLLKLWAKFREGDDGASETVRFMVRNTPFINLFYTKLAVDYLFMYELQEATSPGYWKRMERRMKKDSNQEFIVPPSTYVR